MGGFIVVSGNYQIEGIGIVHVNVRRTARNVSASWKGGMIHVTAPTGIAVDTLRSILVSFAPRLEQARPRERYAVGQKLDFGDFRVDILGQSRQPDKMLLSFSQRQGCIEVGTDWDMESASTTRAISGAICRMAQKIAADVLLPQARSVAARVGAKPLVWTISNGRRVLGHCSHRGEIALSYMLVFYPTELREFVVCHELAHLSEMNHSPRFHKICDGYLNGCEKQLIAQLKSYRPPVLL